LPHVKLVDAVGASETGAQGVHVSSKQADVSSGRFALGPQTCVLHEDLTHVLLPGDQATGWLAQRGRVPLGYLGDPDKTARTFPVIDGVRYAVPGDRARLRPDGTIDLLGRDAATINSGGEKIFAEEIELALKQHPAVYDAVVCGRPSPRWGQEVCAIVQVRPGTSVTEPVLLAECEKHLARFKLPKAFFFVDIVVRSPSGKADYRWAKQQVG
jgi:fatty-acyl-CoA synthase